MDQLISGTPGLVGQTTGKLTTSQYSVATIFVDHYLDLDYVHVQESTSAADTVEAKQAFERFCKERDVTVLHYHADNGIFVSNGFCEEVQRCGQTISFCGVGAHHQNGVAERHIQDLTQTARASLAHAAHQNPAVTAHLWPYALKHASFVRQLVPQENHSKPPSELFSKAPVRPTTKYLHPFGCPVYVLKGKLQSGNSIPKWEEHLRVGIYLGHSSLHATSVSLILNPQTGFVSPQLHCIYNDQFDSCKHDANFSAVWADKAGLQSSDSVSDDEYQVTLPSHFNSPFTLNEHEPSVISPTIPVPVGDQANVEVPMPEPQEVAPLPVGDFDVKPQEQQEIPADMPEHEGVNTGNEGAHAEHERANAQNATRSG